MVGFCVSWMVTCSMQVAVLPEGSVVVHLTLVVPPVKTAGASLTGSEAPQLSPALAVPRSAGWSVRWQVFGSGGSVRSDGQKMTGLESSSTLTVATHSLNW